MPRKVLINGYTMNLNPSDFGVSEYIAKGCYEQRETDVVKSIVKQGDVCLDIGANIGYFTMLLSRLVGDKGTVYAFEPNLSNFIYLTTNVQSNKCNNVITHLCAVSDRLGYVKLYNHSSNMGAHSMVEDNVVYDEYGYIVNTELVSTISLDSYFQHKIDFIKMDVQGAEPLVINGGMQVIAKFKPVMLMEFSWYGFAKAGHDPIDFYRKIVDIGYECHPITMYFEGVEYDSQKMNCRNNDDIIKLIVKCKADNNSHLNLLFKKI